MDVFLIRGGTVENCVVLESIEKFKIDNPQMYSQYDYVIERTDENSYVGIGWLYDGTRFYRSE